ncbi:hypothetical protein Gasu2_14570 [Galdieria sulphuraria]|nr:hypothetical protein Gasu2_14570 [Galdieria sulphuraria]
MSQSSTSECSDSHGLVSLLKDMAGNQGKTEDSVEPTKSLPSQGPTDPETSPSKDKNTKKQNDETLRPLSFSIVTVPSVIVAVSHQAKAQLYPLAVRVQSFWKRYLQHCQSLTDTLLRAQYIDNTRLFGEKLSKRMLRQTTEAMDSAKTAVSTLVKGNKKSDN